MLTAHRLVLSLALATVLWVSSAMAETSIEGAWEFVADRVMGGRSTGTMTREVVDGRDAVRLRGSVSLENNGGFVQIAQNLSPDGSSIDASAWAGIEIEVRGNGEVYGLHLRTDDVIRPWQSYRQSFSAPETWEAVRLPFADFAPHRIDTPLDLRSLRRIGLVAIGRAFEADLAVANVRFYR